MVSPLLVAPLTVLNLSVGATYNDMTPLLIIGVSGWHQYPLLIGLVLDATLAQPPRRLRLYITTITNHVDTGACPVWMGLSVGPHIPYMVERPATGGMDFLKKPKIGQQSVSPFTTNPTRAATEDLLYEDHNPPSWSYQMPRSQRW